MRLHILEDKVCARVRFVAANDAREWQEGAVLANISQGDVVHVDSGLRLTPTERVEEAARVVGGARLVLLLGSNIDGPPDRVVDLDVVVQDVSDLAA